MVYLVALETYVMLFLSMHFLQGTYNRSNQCVNQFLDESVQN